MEFQEIDIVIDKDGQVHLHVRGAAGEICLQLTSELENILGDNIVEREFTPEFQEKPGNALGTNLKSKT